MYPFSPAFANFPPLSRSYAPVLSFPPLPKARYRHFCPIIVLYHPRQSLPKARYRHFRLIIVLYHNTLSKKAFH